jgi:hypothetical protein
MTENQRQFPRQSIQIEVQIQFLEDEPQTVITKNVSQGGLFLRLGDSAHYTMGEMINMSFKDPHADYTNTNKDGIIVRHTDDGIAIAFIEIEGF